MHGTKKNIEFENCVNIYQNCLLDLVCLPCVRHRYMCLLHIYFLLSYIIPFFLLSSLLYFFSVQQERVNKHSSFPNYCPYSVSYKHAFQTKCFFLKTNKLFFIEYDKITNTCPFFAFISHKFEATFVTNVALVSPRRPLL